MNSQNSVNTENTELGGNTKPPSSMRRVCFTLNNYNEVDWNTIIHRYTSSMLLCVGKEVGENGTPHLQGYVEFKNPKKWQTVKNLFPRSHLEKARGSRQDNIAYCSKSGGEFFSNFPLTLTQQVMCDYDGVEVNV